MLETRSAGMAVTSLFNLLFSFVIGQTFLSMLCTLQVLHALLSISSQTKSHFKCLESASLPWASLLNKASMSTQALTSGALQIACAYKGCCNCLVWFRRRILAQQSWKLSANSMKAPLLVCCSHCLTVSRGWAWWVHRAFQQDDPLRNDCKASNSGCLIGIGGKFDPQRISRDVSALN